MSMSTTYSWCDNLYTFPVPLLSYLPSFNLEFKPSVRGNSLIDFYRHILGCEFCNYRWIPSLAVSRTRKACQCCVRAAWKYVVWQLPGLLSAAAGVRRGGSRREGRERRGRSGCVCRVCKRCRRRRSSRPTTRRSAPQLGGRDPPRLRAAKDGAQRLDSRARSMHAHFLDLARFCFLSGESISLLNQDDLFFNGQRLVLWIRF